MPPIPSAAIGGSAGRAAAAATTQASAALSSLLTVCDNNQRQIFSYLNKESKYSYGVTHRQLYSIFKPDFLLHQFQTHVAQGQQQLVEVQLIAEKYRLTRAQVEVVLETEIATALKEGRVIIAMPGVRKKLEGLLQSKVTILQTDSKTTATSTPGSTSPNSPSVISSLLSQKSLIPVMDYAGEETGESFLNTTAFQIAVIQNDTHMYRMMLRYLPREQAKKQWEELQASGEINPLNYRFFHMPDGDIPKQQGEIHFRVKDDSLIYSLVTLYGEVIIDRKIPRNILPPPPPPLDEKSEPMDLLQYVEANRDKILQYTAAQFQTGKIGTKITRGRCKIEKIKHHLRNFHVNYQRWGREWEHRKNVERKRLTEGKWVHPVYDFNALVGDPWSEYYCFKVGVAQRHGPAHITHEYARLDRAFDPTPKCDERTLPRVPKHYNAPNFHYLRGDGIPLYPLRIYKCVVAVDDITKFDVQKTPVDSHTIVLERKVGKLTAYWKKDGRLVPSRILDEKEEFNFFHVPKDELSLPLPGTESTSKNLIACLLYKFGCDSGFCSHAGLVRCGRDNVRIAGHSDSPLVDVAEVDAKAINALWQARCLDDLDLLERDLYQESPSLMVAAAADDPEPQPTNSCSLM